MPVDSAAASVAQGAAPNSGSIKNQLPFYGVVTLLTLIDNAVLTGVIWLSLQLTGSAVPLGAVLCSSIAVPFVLEKWLGERVTQISLRRLASLRIAVFAALAIFAMLGVANLLFGFLLLALGVGIVDYFTVTAFETRNAKMVLDGLVSANQAAKRIQTAIQIGGFGGALIGGSLLGFVSGSGFLVLMGLAGAALSLSLLWLGATESRTAGADRANASAAASAAAAPMETAPRARLRVGFNHATGLLICLALIGFHIGAFNSMLPMVYQRVRGWDPAMFGLAGGCAGLGAFLVAVLPTLRVHKFVFPLLLIGIDALLVWASFMLASVAAAFLVGFASNFLRISVREQLINCAHVEADAQWIGSRGAYASLSLQAFAPLLLTFLTSDGVLSPSYAPLMMVLSGLLLAIGMLLVQGPLWRAWRPAA